MKNRKPFLLGFLSATIILNLCNCGGEMDNWPYCDLPDTIASYESLTIKIIVNDLPNAGGETETHEYFSDDSEMVLEFYNFIEAMRVSPKKTYKTFENFYAYVLLDFKKSNTNYYFEYYELALTDGYFIFDKKDIYEFKGDFYGAIDDNIQKNMNMFIEL